MDFISSASGWIEKIGNELTASDNGVDVQGATLLLNDQALTTGKLFAFSAFYRYVIQLVHYDLLYRGEHMFMYLLYRGEHMFMYILSHGLFYFYLNICRAEMHILPESLISGFVLQSQADIGGSGI